MKKIVSAVVAMAIFCASFTSCEPRNITTGTAEVQIGMNLVGADRPANAPQYSPADSVYFNSGNQNTIGIKDIYVVPMFDNVAQKPVKLDDLVANSTSTSSATTMLIDKNTNRFLIYANAGTIDVNKNFDANATTFSVDPTLVNLGKVGQFHKPHPVYLFADGKSSNNNLEVRSSAQAWNQQDQSNAWTAFNANSTKFGTGAGEMNQVKIKGVTYAIGTLAAAVFHGDYKAKGKKVNIQGSGSTTPSDLTEDWINTNVELVGITVEGQTKTFDYTFTPQGADVVTVFSHMNNTANGTSTGTKLSIKSANDYTSSKMSFENARTTANGFVVVAPCAKETVVNLVFKNKSQNAFSFSNSDATITSPVYQPDEYFFVSAKLLPNTLSGGSSSPFVFEKGYTTILNAKITNWEKGTVKPQTSVDVQVGIEVDLSWKAGVVYNEEI